MKQEKKKFDYNIVLIALCFMMILLGMGIWGAKGLFVVPVTSALNISRSAYSFADTRVMLLRRLSISFLGF